jgi:DNA-binding Lrp family transcriptional regulator
MEQNMDREEVRAMSWNTFRENMLQHAKEHPEFSLTDFILQRVHGAYVFWREARTAERWRDYKKARVLYLKAAESIEQAEKLTEYPLAAAYVEMLKTQYYEFVVHRDPFYRLNLRQILPLLKEEPGILQTQIYERLQLSRPEITYTLYFAEKEGLVRREKKGRSYQLFFQREKPLDEPLLSIQDDEIDRPISQKNRELIGHKPIPVNPEDQKFGCLTIIMFVLILVSIFIGPFGFITFVAALVILIYISRKAYARQKSVREKTVQDEVASPPETLGKRQEETKN